jgi:hypothetical protein
VSYWLQRSKWDPGAHLFKRARRSEMLYTNSASAPVRIYTQRKAGLSSWDSHHALASNGTSEKVLGKDDRRATC